MDSNVKELHTFYGELVNYSNLAAKNLVSWLTLEEQQRAAELFRVIGRKVGRFGALISELSRMDSVIVQGQKSEMWSVALKIPLDSLSSSALTFCVQATNRAIGALEEDIRMGKRNAKTGELLSKPGMFESEPPKAFIAHGGDSPALSKLKRFLEALDVQPLVVEEQASEDRSVGANVDWYSKQADCAIILATKGDIDGKTGGFIPRGNVLMEVGKLQEMFKGRIIYLLQSGTKFPTNVSEKVWGRFSPQSMDGAFTKAARELRAFGILKAVKPQNEASL